MFFIRLLNWGGGARHITTLPASNGTALCGRSAPVALFSWLTASKAQSLATCKDCVRKMHGYN